MTTYGIQIRCLLTGGDFKAKERSLEISIPGVPVPVQVDLSEPTVLEGEWTLGLRLGGFPSDQEARVVGVRLKTALMLAGVLLGVGVDVGTDEVVGQPNPRPQIGPLGLKIFPEPGPPMSASVWYGRPRTRLSPGAFEARTIDGYALDWPLTKKQLLATLLYNQSHFHTSDAGRLFSLVSAIEVLAERERRSEKAIALLIKLQQEIRDADGLEDVERQSLMNGIGELQTESISSACRRLVATHCDHATVTEFKEAYKARSVLLHDGEAPAGTDLKAIAGKLDGTVARLIVAHVSTSRASRKDPPAG